MLRILSVIASVDAIFAKSLASMNQQLEKAGLEPIKITTSEVFEAEE